MTLVLPPNIIKKTPLIVAVSGGSDSVALLHLLRAEGFSRLIVAHLDHGMRSNSAEDIKFVKQLAKLSGARFISKKLNIAKLAKKNQLNLEDAGRRARYDFFVTLKKKFKAGFIVTAHHADDQVETILMNIIRGCGLDGLSGMQEIDGDLWRPLLSVTKKELMNYCRIHKLSFVEDSTNDDLQYRRNFLRKKVIPSLLKLNPQLQKTMTSNAELWTKTRDYVHQRAMDFLGTQRLSPNRYDLKAFRALPEFEQQVTLRTLFEQIHGHKKDLQQSHLEQVMNVLRSPVSGKQKEFGAGRIIVKGKGWLEVKRSR